jgi:hypothetical protein
LCLSVESEAKSYDIQGKVMSQKARVLIPNIIAVVCVVLSSEGWAYGANCSSTVDCAQKGEAAYRKGDYHSAIAFYQVQVQDAEIDKAKCEQAPGPEARKNCDSITIPAYNNVALANLHAGEPAKARMWLSMAPHDSRTDFNKQLVAKAISTFRWPTSPIGEYWSSAGIGLWNEVDVTKSGDLFKISFDGYWFPPSGWSAGPNSGRLSDVVPIQDGVAVLHSSDDAECAVTVRFKVDRVELSETNACEGVFGADVRANGKFDRVSDRVN